MGQIKRGVYPKNVPDQSKFVKFFKPGLPLQYHGVQQSSLKGDKNVPVELNTTLPPILWIYCAVTISFTGGVVTVSMGPKSGKKYNLTFEQLVRYDEFVKEQLFLILGAVPKLRPDTLDVSQDHRIYHAVYPETVEIIKGQAYAREYEVIKDDIFDIDISYRRREASLVNKDGLELLPLITAAGLHGFVENVKTAKSMDALAKTARASMQRYNAGLTDVVGGLNQVVKKTDESVTYLLNSNAHLHHKVDQWGSEINEGIDKVATKGEALGDKVSYALGEIDQVGDKLDSMGGNFDVLVEQGYERNDLLRHGNYLKHEGNELLNENNQLQTRLVQQNNELSDLVKEMITQIRSNYSKEAAWRKSDKRYKIRLVKLFLEQNKSLREISRTLADDLKVTHQALSKFIRNNQLLFSEVANRGQSVVSNSVHPSTGRDGNGDSKVAARGQTQRTVHDEVSAIDERNYIKNSSLEVATRGQNGNQIGNFTELKNKFLQVIKLNPGIKNKDLRMKLGIQNKKLKPILDVLGPEGENKIENRGRSGQRGFAWHLKKEENKNGN